MSDHTHDWYTTGGRRKKYYWECGVCGTETSKVNTEQKPSSSGCGGNENSKHAWERGRTVLEEEHKCEICGKTKWEWTESE